LALVGFSDYTYRSKNFKKFMSQNYKSLVVLQPLRWCCVKCVIHHERDVPEEQHHTYTWREQEILE